MLYEQENTVLVVKNFYGHITPNMWPPNSLDLQSPWLFYEGHGWAREQQNSAQQQRWTEGKDNGSIYQFQLGDHRKGM